MNRMDLRTNYSMLEQERQRFIEKLQKESKEYIIIRNHPDERFLRLRNALHQENCRQNHTDGCGYFYGEEARKSSKYHLITKEVMNFLSENDIDLDYAIEKGRIMKKMYESFC